MLGNQPQMEYRKVLNAQYFDKQYDDIVNNELIAPVWKDHQHAWYGEYIDVIPQWLRWSDAPASRWGQSDTFAFRKRKWFKHTSNIFRLNDPLHGLNFMDRQDVEIDDYYIAYNNDAGRETHYAIVHDAEKAYLLINGVVHIVSPYIESVDYKLYVTKHVKGRPAQFERGTAPKPKSGKTWFDAVERGGVNEKSFNIIESAIGSPRVTAYRTYTEDNQIAKDSDGKEIYETTAPIAKSYIYTQDIKPTDRNQFTDYAGWYMYAYDDASSEFPYSDIQENQQRLSKFDEIKTPRGVGQVFNISSNSRDTTSTNFGTTMRWDVTNTGWHAPPINTKCMVFPSFGDIVTANMTFGVYNIHYVPDIETDWMPNLVPPPYNVNDVVILRVSAAFGGSTTYKELVSASTNSKAEVWGSIGWSGGIQFPAFINEKVLGRDQSGVGIQCISACYNNSRMYIQTKGALYVTNGGIDVSYINSASVVSSSIQERIAGGFGSTFNNHLYHLVPYQTWVLALRAASIDIIRQDTIKRTVNGESQETTFFNSVPVFKNFGIHNRDAYFIHNQGLYVLTSNRKFYALTINFSSGWQFTTDAKDQGIEIQKYLSKTSDEGIVEWDKTTYNNRRFSLYMDDEQLNIISRSKDPKSPTKYRTEIYVFDGRYYGWHTWTTDIPISKCRYLQYIQNRNMGTYAGDPNIRFYFARWGTYAYSKDLGKYNQYHDDWRTRTKDFDEYEDKELNFGQYLSWYMYIDDQTTSRNHKFIKLIMGGDVDHEGKPTYLSPKTKWAMEFIIAGTNQIKHGNFMSLRPRAQWPCKGTLSNTGNEIVDPYIHKPVTAWVVDPGDCIEWWQYGQFPVSYPYFQAKINTGFPCSIVKVHLGAIHKESLQKNGIEDETKESPNDNFFTFHGYLTGALLADSHRSATREAVSNLESDEICGTSYTFDEKSWGGLDISLTNYKIESLPDWTSINLQP